MNDAGSWKNKHAWLASIAILEPAVSFVGMSSILGEKKKQEVACKDLSRGSSLRERKITELSLNASFGLFKSVEGKYRESRKAVFGLFV